MKLGDAVRRLTRGPGNIQGTMSVAISEDRKSIVLNLPGGFQAAMTVESARVVADGLNDAADELEPPPSEPE